MSTFDLAQLLAEAGGVGSVLPLLAAVFNQPRWPSWARVIPPLVLAIVAGVIIYGQTHPFDWSSWYQILITIAGVALTSAVAYRTIWAAIAPQLENATSPRSQRTAPPLHLLNEPAETLPNLDTNPQPDGSTPAEPTAPIEDDAPPPDAAPSDAAPSDVPPPNAEVAPAI